MKKSSTAVALAAALLALTACSAPTAPTETATATPTAESTPTPTPTATPESDAYAFGDSVELDYAGSVWSVTIQAPTTTRPEVSADFPLDNPDTQYVTIPGSVTRVSGEPMEPVSEVDVQIIVDRKTIDSEYLSTDDSFPGSVNSLPETFAGGNGDFEQIFVVPAGAEVKTVSVTVGMGEAGERVFFGEAVDLGLKSAEDSSASDAVESAKYLWNEAGTDYRNELLGIVGLTPGGTVTDDSVSKIVSTFEEVGFPLNEAEGREFLEWAVQQQP